jgi:hypothetical protein
MNGRLYDPLLRRFLNADENIQDSQNTQNYNKYAYVINNPLIYTDVSGEDFGISLIVAVAVAVFTSVATDYYLNRPVNLDNMFQSVIMSLASAGIANGIGDVFRVGGKVAEALGKTGTIIARAGAHAITQGALSYMQGGNFWSGALSGAFASIAGDLLKLPQGDVGKSLRNPIVRFMTGAITGGIGSSLAGGNFWQGAAIGGIVTVFNHLGLHEPPPEGFDGDYWYDKDNGDEYFRRSDGSYSIKHIDGSAEILIKKVSISNYKWLQRNLSNADRLGKIGDAVTLLGYALTLTGFGAEVGIPLVAIGMGINLVSDAWKIGVNLKYNDINKGSEIAKTIGWAVAGEVIPKSIAKPLGKNIGVFGEQIIEQNLGLKVSLVEEVINLNSSQNGR